MKIFFAVQNVSFTIENFYVLGKFIRIPNLKRVSHPSFANFGSKIFILFAYQHFSVSAQKFEITPLKCVAIRKFLFRNFTLTLLLDLPLFIRNPLFENFLNSLSKTKMQNFSLLCRKLKFWYFPITSVQNLEIFYLKRDLLKIIKNFLQKFAEFSLFSL